MKNWEREQRQALSIEVSLLDSEQKSSLFRSEILPEEEFVSYNIRARLQWTANNH